MSCTKDMTVSATTSRHCHDKKSDHVSIAEAAMMLGVTERTIARLIAQKSLRSQKKNGRRFIDNQSLQIHLANQSGSAVTLSSINERLDVLERLLRGVLELYKPDSVAAINRKRELLDSYNKPRP